MTDPLRGNDSPISVPDVTAFSDPLIASPETVLERTALAEEAHTLADEVSRLRSAADKIATRTHRNEWGVRLTAIGLVADIVLSVIALFLFGRLETSIHEQCTLDALIIPSYSDAAKQRSPLGPLAYDDAFRRIQVSSDHLACGIPHIKELG